MFDYQNIFHTGFLVPDIDVAMKEMGDALGLEWATPWRHDPMKYWTPQGNAEASMLITYSKRGPQHVELIQGTGYWTSSAVQGVHHVGVWSANMPAEIADLTARGWTVMAAAASPEEGWKHFCYLRPPSGGMLLELVSTDIKPLMAQRLA